MGYPAINTIVYVGTARLPELRVGPVTDAVIELSVDPAAGRIVAVATNLRLPALDQLLWELLVGADVSHALDSAVLELEVRYCSPLTPVVIEAVREGLGRARSDAVRPRSSRTRITPERAAVVG